MMRASLFTMMFCLLAGLCSVRCAEGAGVEERPRKVYAHYMGCFPVASGPIGYWRSKVHETRHDSRDPGLAIGNEFRNWPLVPPGTQLTAEQSADLDIRRAVRAGFDGFALDAWAGHQSKEVLAALFKVAEQRDYPFEITVCLDPNCHAAYTRGDNPKGLVQGYSDTIRYLLETHGTSPKLARRDGKPLIFGYHSRGLGRTLRSPDALADPANWPDLCRLYADVEANVGQPLFFHFGMGAFFYGCDLNTMPGARPPHEPGPWIVKAAAAMAECFPAIGSFIGRNITAELPDMARAVRAAGAEWAEPLWHQYQRMSGRGSGALMVENGTDKLRGCWQRARDNSATLIQYVTWNDYGEATNTAPDTNTRYALLDLNSYFIHWWKYGEPPVPDHDKVYLISRHYPAGCKVFPFRSQRYQDGVLEVLTLLPRAATVRLPGRGVEYEAPAGLSYRQAPLVPGPVVAEVLRDGAVAVRLESPEPITARPFREENIMDCFSTEFGRHWRADFGDAPHFYASEYGDTDSDGLPNWFEMYWFGRFFDWSTADVAEPDADPDGDGQSNLEEYLAQTDPTTPPPVYRPGDIWDMRGVYGAGVSTNPDPDFNGTPAWYYLYALRPLGAAAPGEFQPCPRAINRTPYTGPMVHMSPYRVDGYGNTHGWICRQALDPEGPTAPQQRGQEQPRVDWALVFRPRTECLLALAWESPVNGMVNVAGRLQPEPVLADPMTVTITQDGTPKTLFREQIGRADARVVDLRGISVRRGQRLLISVDSLPGGDSGAVILEKLNITLTETAPVAAETQK
jgi:hypothetical protein